MFSQNQGGLLSSPNLNDPAQTSLYFQAQFSKIFSSFLSASSSSEGDLSNNNADSDLFGGSTSDPFSANTNFQLAQMSQLQGNFFSASNLDLLNRSAALIGKEADYILDGRKRTGKIDSVVNENGVIAFKIDDQLVSMEFLREIREGVTHA
ncbi:MAG: hypothetical protein AABZ14_01600 [Candidatus Margulisiibacteriota bacterium]